MTSASLRPLLWAFAFWASATSVAAAQPAASTLPGGASSLQETYEDWSVACAQPQGRKVCALSQQQVDNRSRQRIMSLELGPPTAGKVAGILVLPFGLAFAPGVILEIDDAPAGPALPFSTCYASGCVVPVSFDAKAVASLKKATALKVKATAEGGQAVNLTVSLKGFAGALDRVAELMK